MELNTAKLFITLELFITVVIEMVAEKLKIQWKASGL